MLTAGVVAALLLVSPLPDGPTPTPPSWQVVVRPFVIARDGVPATFWVGLRNRTALDRAFCRLGVFYEFALDNGDTVSQPSQEYPAIGSPHPCRDEDGTLVFPGETHFVQVTVTLPANALPTKGLRFEVVAQEACARSGRGDRASIIAIGESPTACPTMRSRETAAFGTPTIVVRVVDQLWLPLPGADVRLDDRSGGQAYSGVTNRDGDLALVVPAGEYTVRAQLVGFKVKSVKDVAVGESEAKSVPHVQIQMQLKVPGVTVD